MPVGDVVCDGGLSEGFVVFSVIHVEESIELVFDLELHSLLLTCKFIPAFVVIVIPFACIGVFSVRVSKSDEPLPTLQLMSAIYSVLMAIVDAIFRLRLSIRTGVGSSLHDCFLAIPLKDIFEELIRGIWLFVISFLIRSTREGSDAHACSASNDILVVSMKLC